MLLPSIVGDNFGVDFFDDFFPYRRGALQKNANSPMKTDIKDLGDSYQLDMELPGMAREDIRAELKDGYLTVTAEKNSSTEEKDEDNR